MTRLGLLARFLVFAGVLVFVLAGVLLACGIAGLLPFVRIGLLGGRIVLLGRLIVTQRRARHPGANTQQ
jgi:hypothetical protein